MLVFYVQQLNLHAVQTKKNISKTKNIACNKKKIHLYNTYSEHYLEAQRLIVQNQIESIELKYLYLDVKKYFTH